jgi:hypothetical protein
MRPIISTHFSNDDHRLYAYVRDSKIPHGTFGPRYPWGSVVLWVACALIVLCLVGAAA